MKRKIQVSVFSGMLIALMGTFAVKDRIYTQDVFTLACIRLLQGVYFSISIASVVFFLSAFWDGVYRQYKFCVKEKAGIFLYIFTIIIIFLGSLDVMKWPINALLFWLFPSVIWLAFFPIGFMLYREDRKKRGYSFLLISVVSLLWYPAMLYIGTLYLGV